MSDPATLPTFLVIGAMKAGTTSLAAYLESHPEVFMATPKEIEFFSEHWDRGLDWYREHFVAGRDVPARGEASTGYTKAGLYPEAAARIAATLPDVRLVYVVRDPVERIRSHYDHARLMLGETRPPEVAVLDDPMYLDASRYGHQLERHLAVVDRSQVLVVAADGLRADRAATLRRIFAFIGVDPDFTSPTFDHEFYVTSDRSTLRPGVRSAAGLPLVRSLKRLAPTGLKQRIARSAVASHQPEETARPGDLPPALVEELRSRLAEDEALLARLGGVDVGA